MSQTPAPNTRAQSLHVADEVVVLTGDLVASSKLAPGDLAKALGTLETASDAVAAAFGQGPARFGGFRGDGWQCLGPEPRFALRGALVMRASLSALGRAFDTRISVGVGSGWRAEEADVEVASGPAFELSGKGLDTMEHARRFAVAWEERRDGEALVRAIYALCDEISRNWTPGQARVFARLLIDRERPNQEVVARDLGITQQSVATHLAGGGDWAIQEALKAVEAW